MEESCNKKKCILIAILKLTQDGRQKWIQACMHMHINTLLAKNKEFRAFQVYMIEKTNPIIKDSIGCWVTSTEVTSVLFLSLSCSCWESAFCFSFICFSLNSYCYVLWMRYANNTNCMSCYKTKLLLPSW